MPYGDVPWLADTPGGDIEALALYGTSGDSSHDLIIATIDVSLVLAGSAPLVGV